jgi:hypothetical protein
MYFLFQTKYSVSSAMFDANVQSLGSMFVHNTGVKENKVCLFGKIVAVLAIGLAFLRVYALQKGYSKRSLLIGSLVFDIVCLVIAALMNSNAFLYILPLFFAELYIFTTGDGLIS